MCRIGKIVIESRSSATNDCYGCIAENWDSCKEFRNAVGGCGEPDDKAGRIFVFVNSGHKADLVDEIENLKAKLKDAEVPASASKRKIDRLNK